MANQKAAPAITYPYDIWNWDDQADPLEVWGNSDVPLLPAAQQVQPGNIIHINTGDYGDLGTAILDGSYNGTLEYYNSGTPEPGQPFSKMTVSFYINVGTCILSFIEILFEDGASYPTVDNTYSGPMILDLVEVIG